MQFRLGGAEGQIANDLRRIELVFLSNPDGSNSAGPHPAAKRSAGDAEEFHDLCCAHVAFARFELIDECELCRFAPRHEG